jgi:acetyl esterase/lipase
MNTRCLNRLASSSTILLALLAATATTAAEAPARTIELWPEGAPGATGTTNEDKPAITVYLPNQVKNTGAAVLICPGGGFMTRAVDHEGVLIANWFQARGVSGFILRYRIRPIYTMKESIQDTERGISYVRAHAGDFAIDSSRIGIIGFSAGAMLASSVALKMKPGTYDAIDPIDRASSKVAFQILAYGSLGVARPAAGQATDTSASKPSEADWKAAPPTFLFGTTEDANMIRGMTDLYANLSRAKVPVEAHFFAHGVHGVGFAQGDPVLGAWPELMWSWLRAGGFLTHDPRVAIRGIVTVDGEPLAHGCVILTPLDSSTSPPVVAYVMNTGQVRGEFALPAGQGPTPGRYRIEVHQNATRWMSNSQDPVMSSMSFKAKNGTITESERREWIAYARKRDLSPSISEERVFGSLQPDGKNAIVAEIKNGGESRINLDLSTR